MPAKSLIIADRAYKQLTNLSFGIQKRIEKALGRLQQNPVLGIKLHGELANYYKLRVGDYRVVYRFDTKTSTVVVVKIEHRQGVYK